MKRSTSKFFIARPEIKQSSDKNVISLQGLDRQRQVSENYISYFFNN